MKKFLRMVVVFALAAGASLAYTSCTKDYDNEIKDLNTEISALQSTVSGLQTAISNLEALASTVSSQGGDISGIKATISQLQSAVDAIKGNYVTEDEAKAIAKNAVSALKEEVEAMKAEMVTQEDLYDILSELSGGVLELMAALEMQVVGSVQSIVKLPAWYWGGVNDMDADRIQAYNMTDGLGNEVVPMSAVISAAFNVYPPTAAEKLAEDALVALRFMIPAFDVDTYVLGEIYDYTDDGDIYVKIDMTEIYDLISSTPALAPVLGNNICYGSVILLDDLTIPAEDEDDEDTVLPLTSIASTFFNIDVPAGATDVFFALSLYDPETDTPYWGGALPDIEVPYNKYANSTHNFGEGLEVSILGGYSIDEFAEMYNMDPALLTPEIEITKQAPFTTQGARATKAPKFAYDEDSAEIKMDVTKLADAKAQIDNHADVNINLKVGGNVANAFTQQYLVVEAEGGNVVIEGETFTWKGGATTYALTDDEALVEPADIKVPAAGFNFAVGAGNPGLNVPVNVQYLANEHVNLAKVTYPAGAFTYAANAAKRKLTYEHIDADFVKTIYTMTVTVGPKPKNKTLDLGTYYANGSASNAVPVDLSGIMQKMIDSDAALWAQVPVTAANPLLNQFAAGVWTPVSVIDETTSVAQPIGSFVTAFAYNAGTKKDATTLTIAAPLGFYGQKYAVSGTYTIMGVTYTVTYHVVIREASYTMVSTPYVQEGNIVPVEGAIVGGVYALDDIHMSKYFQIDNNGEAINDVLTVDFTFDYEWDGKTPAVRYAPAGAINVADNSEVATATGISVAGAAVNAANGQLVDAAGATVQWGTYGGRKIYGTAQLMAAGTPLGEPIEFTLQTANPIKSLEGRPTVLKRYSGVDVDYFAPKDSLNIVTVLTDKNVAPTPKVLHAAKYPEYAITVGAFVDGEGYKPWATTVYPTLQGKLNGVDFTFTDNVHYKILADGRVQFLKDNAYGDIEVNIPLCIIHVLDYDHGVYTDPDADGFGVYSFTEGVEIINFPVVIKQQ